MKFFLFKALAAALVLVGLAIYAAPEDEIAERIKKVGSVCVEGEDCGAVAAASSSAQASDAGDDLVASYNMTCATCHKLGVAGAPKRGDAAAWAPRLEKGMEVLYNAAINGMPPAMPPKGMCFACSDDDLKALVDYMVETVE
ncbi:MAG: c-type cytochrome [Pseudomonadales bacterium]